jgi:hypothetical protein
LPLLFEGWLPPVGLFSHLHCSFSTEHQPFLACHDRQKMPPKKQPAVPLGLADEAIPLQCLLCPKKPTFSDVSHLLTHISSKSHLSNRFKTEIRSNKERDARETLRRFDDWYTRYGIQGLLADRMTAKDKKNLPKRSRAQTQAVSVPLCRVPAQLPSSAFTNRGLVGQISAFIQ